MNQAKAIKATRDAVYRATEVLAELERAGRLPAKTSEMREQIAEDAAEYVQNNWISFDPSEPPAEPAEKPTGQDVTRPGMETAMLAAEMRKRL